MKKKFRLVFGEHGFARAIRYGKEHVVSLDEGSYTNGIYLDWLVDLLNGKETPMPSEPMPRRSNACRE